MTDPISAMISMGTTLIGGGVKAFGSYQQGQSVQAMDNYRARVAQINAQIAKEQASVETVAGELRAGQSGLRTAERVGMTRAAIGAGNLSLSGGSAKGVISSEEEVGQFEQASIRNDAARRAYGYNVAAFGDTAQAEMDTAAGHEARVSAGFDVATSLLGAGTQTADKWMKFNQAGIPPFATG